MNNSDMTIEHTDISLQDNWETLRKDHEELNRVFKLVDVAKREWEKTMDCVADMVILTDKSGRIKRSNNSFRDFIEKPYSELLGKDCVELLVERGVQISELCPKGDEVFYEPTGQWFLISSYPVTGITGNEVFGAVITIHDMTELKKVTRNFELKNRELVQAYDELKATQAKILQQEKMASIGQLAAGVAHEINNPMGFISSNVSTLGKYTERLVEFISAQQNAVASCTNVDTVKALQEARKRLKVDHIIEDTKKLIAESLDGATRVKTIVQNLKNFSRVGQAESKLADINECIETTINIVWNELKYKATLKKDYGKLPLTACWPQQLNQVFMNLLLNASQAIETHGEISVKTWEENNSIFIAVADTGMGIPEKNRSLIFEPFFTTKEVGKGTGLGLSITYDIVKKHHGDITVQSEVGKGAEFTVRIPVVREIPNERTQENTSP